MMSEKKAKVLSFIGGLVFISVVAGVLLYKNDRIRAEFEEQVTSLLKTTGSALGQIRFFVSKVENITKDSKIDKIKDNIGDLKTYNDFSEYDAQWSSFDA